MSTTKTNQQIQPEVELLKISEALSDFFHLYSTSDVIDKFDLSIGAFRKQFNFDESQIDKTASFHARISSLLNKLEVAEMKLRFYQPQGKSPNE